MSRRAVRRRPAPRRVRSKSLLRRVAGRGCASVFGGSGAGRPTPQVRPPPPPPPGEGGGEGRAYERRSDRHARRGHRRAQGAFKNSMTRWLCDSHYLSRFAALFIDAGAKRSVAEGCAARRSRVGNSVPPRDAGLPPAGAAAAGATFGGPRWVASCRRSVMIPPLVHQRRPCYDFYFL